MENEDLERSPPGMILRALRALTTKIHRLQQDNSRDTTYVEKQLRHHDKRYRHIESVHIHEMYSICPRRRSHIYSQMIETAISVEHAVCQLLQSKRSLNRMKMIIDRIWEMIREKGREDWRDDVALYLYIIDESLHSLQNAIDSFSSKHDPLILRLKLNIDDLNSFNIALDSTKNMLFHEKQKQRVIKPIQIIKFWVICYLVFILSQGS